VCVIAWHGVLVCYGPDAEIPYWTGPIRPLVYVILPMFFSLGGFLVSASLYRNDLPSFLTLRVLRIFPALVVQVLLSALLLGPLVTTLSLSEYVTSPVFAAYFQTLLANIQYYLPGVFTANPGGAYVSLPLWTIPLELAGYGIICLLSFIGLLKRPGLLFCTILLACVGITGAEAVRGHFYSLEMRPPGRMLVLCFLLGVSIYTLRKRLPWTRSAFAVAFVLSWISLSFQQTVYLAPLPVAYLTVYLGFLHPPRTRLVRDVDYSYGLYIYGFPVQQTIAHFFPAWRIWPVNVAGAVLVAGCLAFLSWHLLESKVMERRKLVLAVVARLTQRSDMVWAQLRTTAGDWLGIRTAPRK
jgi:peptidoglycan/LPS O-acetylase OafA/YrhL